MITHFSSDVQLPCHLQCKIDDRLSAVTAAYLASSKAKL